MSASDQNDSTSVLTAAYRLFDRDLRVVRANAGYILTLTMMPAGVTLDFIIYPKLGWHILFARLWCVAGLLICWGLSRTEWCRRYYWLLDKPCIFLPCLSICWMIYRSEGAFSTYYAGLNLIIVACCLMIPYTAKEAGIVCAAVALWYAGTCLAAHLFTPAAKLAGQASLWRMLYNNLYFLILSSIMGVTASYYAAARRFIDFKLRHELDDNNRELASTLSRLKDTEVQLVQSEKMNALGKLSAGLLHEVNNPLNFTFMALEAAQSDATDNPTMMETLDDIHQGMSRIRSVISDLRAFAYPTQLSGAEAFSLDDVMSTAQRLTAHELNDVTVTREGIKGFVARGSKDQVVHILMNLLVNAAHATKSKATGRPAKVDVTCETRGKLLAITVRDNGTGVKKENMKKLFEPFFTTKEKGKGTGLGLSICQTIVQNHGGKISLASEEGEWTAVTFELPASQEPLAAAA